MTPKNTICLWFDRDALDAAQFYAATFPDSSVGAVMRAPGDFPDGKQGDVLTVEFTVAGIPCLGLNGGPAFRQSEAFSFQIRHSFSKRSSPTNSDVTTGGGATGAVVRTTSTGPVGSNISQPPHA